MRWAFDLDIPRLLHRPGRGKRAYGPVGPVSLLAAGTLETRRNRHLTLNLPCTWPCGTICCSWTRVCPPSLEPRALSGLGLRVFEESSRVASANSQKAGGPGRVDGCLDASRSRNQEFATRLF